MNWSVNDMLRVAGAGGSFEVSARKASVTDLLRIVGMASNNGGHIDIREANIISVTDVLRITGVGQGAVRFFP